MILKLKDGDVKIELFEDVAPNHVKRIKELADSGQYDNVYLIAAAGSPSIDPKLPWP
ncbi:peptidylprolyl isomerase [Candidatus Pelagibacter sp.]|nr:peptidylprolyl isomerase [Candidatus Pelagibacter sp.]